MRFDQPWLIIAEQVRSALAPSATKPMRLIENEVPPGRLIFEKGRGNWLAILGTVFGLTGAGATLGSTAYRNSNVPALSGPTLPDDRCGIPELGLIYLIPSCFPSRSSIEGLDLYAVLPPGRRQDPALPSP